MTETKLKPITPRNEMSADQVQQYDVLGKVCVAHLEREQQLLIRYLNHIQYVQNAIIEGQYEIPEEKMAEQAAVEADQSKVATAREELIDKISKQCDIPKATVSIKVFAEQLDAECAGKVDTLTKDIVDITERLNAANRLNYLLIQQTIDLQKKLHCVLTGKSLEPDSYTADGTVMRSSGGGMFSANC